MAEDPHGDQCPEGPHAHLPDGQVIPIPQFGGLMFGGLRPEQGVVNERLFRKGEYPDITIMAFFQMYRMAVQMVDGDTIDPIPRLYWELAESSMANDMPRMFRAVTDLFVALAGKQGAPENPAEAMAEMLAIAAEMTELVSQYRERNKERTEEAVSVDNGS